MDGRIYYEKKCQQQHEESHDCGVFVLLWCEAYCRNTPEFWQQQQDMNIKQYRCQVARTILDDVRSVLHDGTA